MKAYRIFLDFYLNSSIHVALGVTALACITALHFGFLPDLDLLAFIFLASTTGYNFVKYAGIAKLHHRNLSKELRAIQIFSFLSFILLLLFAFRVAAEVLVMAGILGVLTLLYALPVLGGAKNLRTLKGVKIFIIAFVWAGTSVFFPIGQKGLPFSADVLIEFFQRFVFVLVLILPFEIRDLKYDDPVLKTLPQTLGVTNTKILGLFLLTIWVTAEFFKDSATRSSIAAILATALVTGILTVISGEKRNHLFESFWVEGVPILWLGFLILFGNIL